MPTALALFERLGGSTPGRWLFTRIVCFRAPYFSSISPLVETLEPGRCVVRLRDRRRIHNHLGTIHAIAMCNAAELAAGLATDATIDANLRWIPKGMQVNYLKPARGTLTATASVPSLDDVGTGLDCMVSVDVRNTEGDNVFSAHIAMWITPRRG
ncbi:MAG TPA: hotdog fold domain-containing protein [Rudaea sp.]|nr:hotdog fold domain-containing protein [Rudaea sp.]